MRGSAPSASGSLTANTKRDQRDMTAALRPAKKRYAAY
jgi:hypothetical protein